MNEGDEGLAWYLTMLEGDKPWDSAVVEPVAGRPQVGIIAFESHGSDVEEESQQGARDCVSSISLWANG